jgi:hypothetical protein
MNHVVPNDDDADDVAAMLVIAPSVCNGAGCRCGRSGISIALGGHSSMVGLHSKCGCVAENSTAPQITHTALNVFFLKLHLK